MVDHPRTVLKPEDSAVVPGTTTLRAMHGSTVEHCIPNVLTEPKCWARLSRRAVPCRQVRVAGGSIDSDAGMRFDKSPPRRWHTIQQLHGAAATTGSKRGRGVRRWSRWGRRGSRWWSRRRWHYAVFWADGSGGAAWQDKVIISTPRRMDTRRGEPVALHRGAAEGACRNDSHVGAEDDLCEARSPIEGSAGDRLDRVGQRDGSSHG